MKTILICLCVVAVLLLTIISSACVNVNQNNDFGIYLADTGELVLSQKHIEAYYAADHDLHLNADGIARWNSFQTYTGIPKLDQTLYNREFVMKINGLEVARGKFYSLASSTLYQGVTITDVLFRLDSQHNGLWIRSEYIDGFTGIKYDNLYSDLDTYFQGAKLLQP